MVTTDICKEYEIDDTLFGNQVFLICKSDLNFYRLNVDLGSPSQNQNYLKLSLIFLATSITTANFHYPLFLYQLTDQTSLA